MIYTSRYKKRPSNKAVRDAIARFERGEISNHTAGGMLLAHILNYCVANGISFTLRHYGSEGMSRGYALMKGSSR